MVTAKGTVIERQELYAAVWREPMLSLSRRYNISDVGLKKICKAMEIPTPPRGHWAKLEHGKKVSQDPLPAPRDGVPDTYTLSPRDIRNDEPEDKVDPPEIAAAKQLLEETDGVNVSDKLLRPVPAIVAMRHFHSITHSDGYSRLRWDWTGNHLDITVSKDAVGRALRIMRTELIR